MKATTAPFAFEVVAVVIELLGVTPFLSFSFNLHVQQVHMFDPFVDVSNGVKGAMNILCIV